MNEELKTLVRAKAGLKEASAYSKIKQVAKLLTGAGVKVSVANTLAPRIVAIVRSK